MKNRLATRNSTLFIFILFISVFVFSSCNSMKYKSKRHLTVVFYNVENLFDLEDAPDKSDEEYTAEGANKWTEDRYQKKLTTLSRVLSSVNENELPEIIGLAEVENRKVIQDLVKTKNLKKGKYKIVHYESPDFRGIDCALIYRPKEFKVLESFPVPIKFNDDPDYITRDILYVKGVTKNKEEFHIFVTHWPSRIGGVSASEPKRIAVAKILKSKIDSVQNASSDAKIIVLGDMNDVPDNTSIAEVLNAKKPTDENAGLVNLMYPLHESKKGSYYFMGDLYMLDNIVISSNLLDDEGFKCEERQGFVFRQEWMEYKNRDGLISPNRTYSGPRYYGGISDHFPVYFQLSR